MNICVIQLSNSESKASNMRNIANLVDAAVEADRPDLIILPEMSACLTSDREVMRARAEPIEGPFHEFLSGLASRHRINILSGSVVEKRGEKFFNTSVLIGRTGEILARYSKIHRFDVEAPDGTKYHESDIVEGGTEVVTAVLEGVTVGFAICYDLRFSVLFDKLAERGADLIVLPAAFTFQTGAAHWEVLLRARAIETQCYVAAAGQVGAFDEGRYMSFGHSMIIDPWGTVVAQVSNQPGFATARFDRQCLELVRQRMPVRQHRVLG